MWSNDHPVDNSVRYYLAGPFFNSAQIELIAEIEHEMLYSGACFFSPRQSDDNKDKGKINKERAARIFDRNWDAMMRSTDLIAVVDWEMPEGQGLYAIQATPYYEILTVEPSNKVHMIKGRCLSPRLNLPDTGTVFEMGVMAALKRNIWLLTRRQREEPLNLMLTECAAGVLYGISSLHAFLKGDRRAAVSYQGSYR